MFLLMPPSHSMVILNRPRRCCCLIVQSRFCGVCYLCPSYHQNIPRVSTHHDFPLNEFHLVTCSGDSDMTFFIDDEEVGYFNRPATGIPGYAYDVPVYFNDSLLAGVHTLRLQNGHVNGIKSLVLLDRIIYS